MPIPKKNETEKDFVERAIPIILEEGTTKDTKQASAIAHSMYKKNKKKEMFSNVHGLKFKESNDINRVVGGFVATTHVDDGWYSEEHGMYIRDKITKEALDVWANEINLGNPRANKVSVNHDRSDPIVAGVGIRGTAEVRELPDGEYGLYVDSLIDGTHPDFSIINNRIEIGTLDSFSIEYVAGSDAVYETTDNDYMIRHLDKETELYGYTLASRPMNENAVMLKEIMDIQSKNSNTKVKETMEENQMAEDEIKKDNVQPETETTEEKTVKSFKVGQKESTPTISAEDMKFLKEMKELQAKKAREDEKKELMAEITKSLKTELESAKVESKVAVAKDELIESKEMIEFKEVLEKPKLHSDGRVTSDIDIKEMFKRAGRLAEKTGLIADGVFQQDKAPANAREYKYFSTNGKLLQAKSGGLGITTNQGSTYYLSAPELRDLFDPVIYNALNQATVTWNILGKDDFSNKGNNLVQFKVKTNINSSLDTSENGFYSGNAVSTGKTTKLQCQTKFKKQQVGVEVDGDMIAAARGGPIGDVFAEAVMSSTEDLLSYANRALFAEKGAETDKGVIGFEYITDSAGNTSLYGITRTSTTLSANNFLAPASAGDTYINGSSADIKLSNLRAAKRQCLKEGSMLGDLVFITDHVQGDKFRGIYDAAQRLVPTSSRFGFEGRPEFDGIPIFEDKDCNDDDWFLVDLKNHRIAMWVPPTLEMLGKDSDSEKGFIKMYWATYNTRPRCMVQIYGNATS